MGTTDQSLPGSACLTKSPEPSVVVTQPDWMAPDGAANAIKNKPTITRIQRLRAQTDTNGLLIWNFATPFDAGTIPIVQLTVEDNVPNAAFNHKITAITNTGVTIQITKTTAVTVLGISVLGISGNPQAWVHMAAFQQL